MRPIPLPVLGFVFAVAGLGLGPNRPGIALALVGAGCSALHFILRQTRKDLP